MALTNSATRYGSVTKGFHWLTALLIATLIPLGIYANGLPYDTSEQVLQKAYVFSLHKTLGVTVFFVALARILWALSQAKPAPLHPERRAETWLAATVHWLLYGSLLLVPLSGWVHHAATDGFAPIWWPLGQDLPFVPKSLVLAEISAGLHIVFERVLVASILLHIAGALKHHFVDRDVTLKRMWFGSTESISEDRHPGKTGPLIAALIVWAGAVGLGNALGVYTHSDGGPAVAELADVPSDWRVQDGTLAVTVSQLGSDVTGSFAEWQAQITFDPDVLQGEAGSVDVTIAIGSLTLGSVTTQALGPDFFAAESFPTARFSAQIFVGDDEQYTAIGTLTIKEKSMPLTLPFALNVSDQTAQMTGSTTLDRLSFGIGETMTDEATLGNSVQVNVTLTAERVVEN